MLPMTTNESPPIQLSIAPNSFVLSLSKDLAQDTVRPKSAQAPTGTRSS